MRARTASTTSSGRERLPRDRVRQPRGRPRPQLRSARGPSPIDSIARQSLGGRSEACQGGGRARSTGRTHAGRASPRLPRPGFALLCGCFGVHRARRSWHAALRLDPGCLRPRRIGTARATPKAARTRCPSICPASRDARPARAVGHRQLPRLPEHLRQPRHPRRRRQDRAADRHGLALRDDTDDRSRHPHGRQVPRRHAADGRRCRRSASSASPTPRSRARSCRSSTASSRRRRRARQGAAAHPSPYPALLAQLVKLSIVPARRREGRQREVQPGADRQRSLPVRQLAEGRARRPSPRTTATGAAGRPSGLSRSGRCRTRRRASPICAPAAPTSSAQLDPDEAASLKEESRLQSCSVPTERIGYLFINALLGPTEGRPRAPRHRARDRPPAPRRRAARRLRPSRSTSCSRRPTSATSRRPRATRSIPRGPGAAQGGRRRGRRISFFTSPAYDQRVVQAIQQMLQEVGLKVDISRLDHPTFLRRRQGKPEEAGSSRSGAGPAPARTPTA